MQSLKEKRLTGKMCTEKHCTNMKDQIMTKRKTTVLGVHPAQPVATGHRIPSRQVRGSQIKTSLRRQIRGPEPSAKKARATPLMTVGLRTTVAEKQKEDKQSNRWRIGKGRVSGLGGVVLTEMI